MNNLVKALEDAVASKRIPGQLLQPTASIRGVCDRLGLIPQTSVRTLINILGLPGNFMPGQPLGIGKESEYAEWKQADVLAVGLDTSLWKFWTSNESPWSSGVVKPTGEMPAGAPLAVQSMSGVLGDEHMVLAVIASANNGAQLNALWQDRNGNWTVGLPANRESWLPKRANVAPYFGETGSFVAVDVTGTLQLYRPDSSSMDADTTWTPTPVSEQSFAPPGAPVAVDQRLAGGMNQGSDNPSCVFVVGNDGAMWAFESQDDGATWYGATLPTPNNISFPPGAHIATGYQAGVFQHIDGETEDLGYCQLDVFAIDRNGVLHMWWESQGSDWTATGFAEVGSFVPGSPIATGYQVFEVLNGVPFGAQLDVFAVDTGGTIRRAWNYKSGNWNFDALPNSIGLPPSAYLATNYQSIDGRGAPHQLDVFAVGLDGRIAVFWQNESPWNCETMPGSDAPVPGTLM